MITLKTSFTENIEYFLKTMVLKNDYVAKLVKDDYTFKFQKINLDDIYSPYYLNLCGEYYPEQKKMKIISIDTGEKIDLTKTTLQNHPKTKYSYKIGNKKFKTLCKAYPDNVQFITSIFYPVIEESLLPYTPATEALMREVISKPNYSLLKYYESFLHINERNSIMNRVLKLLDIIRVRYDIKEFTYEYHYPHIMISNIMSVLYLGVLTQRISNLRTSSVVPDQIWEYLTSHGIADYRDILNLEQSLFLYRNMNYILQNKGKQQNLKYLHDNLLQDSGITLVTKMIVQNSQNCLDTCRPVPEVLSEPYFTNNTPIGALNANDKETLDRIINIEYMDKLEPDYTKQIVANQTEALGKNNQTYNITKLIELRELGIYEPYLNLHFRFILDSLLARISYDDITYHIEIATDNDMAILLNIKESMALMYYCALRIDPQSVELTIDNYKEFIGKHIFYQGELLILTEQNVDKYIGKYVDIRVPIFIPNHTYIKFGFKENLNIDMVPKSFNYLGKTYYMEDYLDVDEIVTSFQKTIVLDSESATTNYLTDKLFKLIDYYNLMYSTFDRITHEAYYVTLHSLLNQSKIDLEFIPNHTEYEDWFKSYPMLYRIINSFNTRSDSSELYSEFLKTIIIATLGKPGTKILLNTLVGNKFLKFKELLKNLCSYTIGFLTTNSNSFKETLHMNAKMFAPFISKHFESYYQLHPPYKLEFLHENIDNSLFPQPDIINPQFYNSTSYSNTNDHLDRDIIIAAHSHGDTIIASDKKIIITEEE